MKIEEISVGGNAENPESVDDKNLPQGIESNAAYVLTEAVEGREIPQIANELDVSSATVTETLRELYSADILSHTTFANFEKDYKPTEAGEAIISDYKKARNAVGNLDTDFDSSDGLQKTIMFGSGQFNAYEEFAFIIDYILNEKSINEFAEETKYPTTKIFDLRDSLKPEIIQDVSEEGSNTVDYEITNTGLQALITLSEADYFERINSFLQETDHEVTIGQEINFNEQEKESSKGVDWSRLKTE